MNLSTLIVGKRIMEPMARLGLVEIIWHADGRHIDYRVKPPEPPMLNCRCVINPRIGR